eukprot:TRINITY_DN33643_c0_g1_i2.p1 TRINITY_DN33643_c0_g1~~TRINITY_DN33643_c0_g1_i2.p1  ORF type:complete len:294 (-),score=19.37 TRINITY_DN33643_c0_g1_i2:353-1234(-)
MSTQLRLLLMTCALSVLVPGNHLWLNHAPGRPALGMAPFLRTISTSSDDPARTAQSARLRASRRARQIICPEVARTVLQAPAYGGLVILRNVLEPNILKQMETEADLWCCEGRMHSTGQAERVRSDSTCTVDPRDAAHAGSFGLCYGVSLLRAACGMLNQHLPEASSSLTPQRSQLSCYDGKGSHYCRHFDAWPRGNQSEKPTMVELRRVTMILYLQSHWKPEWGGAFRGHSGFLSGGQTSPRQIDILPDSGALVLFRSRDLLHEVRPSRHRRFALTTWCQKTVQETSALPKA